ncbi:MAG TPA: hypothetical protein VH682_01460 [Gemmataceae bacterium]
MTTCAPSTATRPESTSSSADDRSGRALLAWTALVLALGLGLPLFLCMPPPFDACHYDLCARKLLHGGILYRDAFDNNLPGIIWMHTAIRGVFGWRAETLRLADFSFMALVVLLLLRWLPAPEGRFTPARVGTAAALAFFYLFSMELGHCQRDGWMLLPATVALCLRNRQLCAIAAKAASATVFGWAVLEGLCWGAAFWIKPFVAVPALACWLVGAFSVRRGRGVTLLDSGGVLAGGLLAGGLGLTWLAASGAWHSFWDVFLAWNRDYAAFTYGQYPRGGMLRLSAIFYFPWHLVQVPAVLIALAAIARAVRGRGTAGPMPVSRALLSAFYLGWLVQAAFIQRSHIYVMMTTIFPAVVVVAGALQTKWKSFLARASLLAYVLLTIIVTPGLRPDRVVLWRRCWREGSTPQLRDRLALNPWKGWAGAADWQDLARVADFLRDEGVADRELICLSGCTHPLYLELDLEPPTRFHQIGATIIHFPAHAEKVRAELEASRSRYVVTDLAANILTYQHALEEAPGNPLALPPRFPPDLLRTYPWCGTLVFRSGRYVVHRISDSMSAAPITIIIPAKPQ